MKTNYKQPLGVNDYLPYDCFVKKGIENKILNDFKSRGFLEVATPAIEYYAVQKNGRGGVPDDKLFKFTDCDGSLLSLRADMTRPISRLVSSKLNFEGVGKFCYVADSFTMEIKNNRFREFSQAGVELIGGDSAQLDAEAIALAIDALINAGLDDFLVDIGQVGYFKGILEELALSCEDEEEIVSLVDKKDMLGLELFAKQRGINNKLESILKLPEMFGGEEVLELAMGRAVNKTSKKAIENLIEINSILKTLGYNKYILFDLSLVNGVSYYTGCVFKVLTKHFGAPLCSGGRYSLTADGVTMSATGFAIGIEYLTKAIEKCGNLPIKPPLDYVVGCQSKTIKQCYQLCADLRKKGFSVDNAFCTTENQLKLYKQQKAAQKAVFVSEKGEVEL